MANTASVLMCMLVLIAMGCLLYRAEEDTCPLSGMTENEAPFSSGEEHCSTVERLLSDTSLKLLQLEEHIRVQSRRIDFLERRLTENASPPSVHTPIDAETPSENVSIRAAFIRQGGRGDDQNCYGRSQIRTAAPRALFQQDNAASTTDLLRFLQSPFCRQDGRRIDRVDYGSIEDILRRQEGSRILRPG